MSRNLISIISSADAGKARAGMMYALNALKHKWMDDVQLIFFGPAQKMILEQKDLQAIMIEFSQIGRKAVACKRISDLQENSADLIELGLDVAYVGPIISDYIHRGYTPLTW